MTKEYQELLNNKEINLASINKNLSNYAWYSLSKDDRDNYIKKIIDYLENNYHELKTEDNQNLKKIIEVTGKCKLSDNLINFLFHKTIETKEIYIYPYNLYLIKFSFENQVEYIKLLNNSNYDHFDSLDFRIEAKWNVHNKILEQIYKNYFFSNDDQLSENKVIPNESYNKFIMMKNMHLFLNNGLVTNEMAEKNIDNFLKNQSSSIFFTEIIKKENEDTPLNNTFEDKITILLNKFLESANVKLLDKQKVIWNIFQNKNNKNFNDVMTSVFTKNKDLKENCLNLLKGKINKEFLNNNEFFKDLIKENIKGLNIGQALLLTQNFSLFNNMIKTDKDYANILNKSIHIEINNYNYEKNIFDIGLMPSNSLGLKRFNKNLKDIIKNKLIENENHKLKDKFCTILFKELTERPEKNTELEIFSLLEFMSASLLRKNMKTFNGMLNNRQENFCEKLIEFKYLNTEIPLNNNNNKLKKIKI